MTTTDHGGRQVRMDRFDRDALTYMLSWDPHGGLYDEDVYPEFGMNVQQFRARVVQLVTYYDIEGLDPADRVLVEDAQHYLRHRQSRGPRRHGS